MISSARSINTLAVGLLFVLIGGCSSVYYNAWEKVGVHKRDIMVDRVEAARNSQQSAQKQFKSALEQFGSVVSLKETDLKKAYDRLNGEYEECVAAADQVSSRIDSIESVSEALFSEWKDEIKLYENKELARASQKQLDETRKHYKEMMVRMEKAEQSMAPVLKIFRDNVLFLKHNLNAQAIGSLQGEFSNLDAEISVLLGRMNEAIDASNTFIATMQAK